MQPKRRILAHFCPLPIVIMLVLVIGGCSSGGDDGDDADVASETDAGSGGDGGAEPRGACCGADCQVMRRSVCQAEGKLFVGADACDPDPCSLGAKEACCRQDGACEISEVNACLASGGQPRGSGTRCESVTCEVALVGACCGPLGECAIVDQVACGLEAGLFIDQDEPSCDPSPCPELELGACCSPNGACLFEDRRKCRDSFLKETECEPDNPCPGPPPDAMVHDAMDAMVPDAAAPDADATLPDLGDR